MTRFAKGLMLAAAMGLTASPVLAAPESCVTAKEVESLALVLLPDVLSVAVEVCAPHLPKDALLARPDSTMNARYSAEAEGALPDAGRAIAKIAGVDADVAKLLGNDGMGAKLFAAILAPKLAEEIKPADCPAINRMVELLEPLPPRNMAALFATVLQLSQKDKKGDARNQQKRSTPDIPICPADFAQ